MRSHNSGYGYMLASGAFFSLMALLVGVVHRIQPEVSPAMTSFVRAIINLLILVGMTWRNPLSLFGDRRPMLWTRGLLGAFSLLAYFSCLARVGIGEAAFLNQTSAFWVALLAPMLLKENTHRWTWVAVAGAMSGMFLLSMPRSGLTTDGVGRLLGAVSGLTASLAYLSVRKAGETNSSRVIVFYFTIVASAVSLVMLAFESVTLPRGIGVWLSLVGVGACATLGQLFMTQAYRTSPASSMAVLSYSGPLFTSLLGWTVLGQSPDRTGLAGMGLILFCGIVLPYFKNASEDPGPAR